ncbi:MAG: sulfatase activating formylglycine-generating enzyme [Parvicellaceae bacterium]|jgi:formylglycine-generating enzyme required for sulfatase activity
MIRNYHWHPAFDNYPIINIPYKGAIAFCAYVEEYLNEQFNLKWDSTLKLTVRLPTTHEWIKAAVGLEDTVQPLPFGYNNYKTELTKKQRKNGSNDTVYLGWRNNLCYNYIYADSSARFKTYNNSDDSCYHSTGPFEMPRTVKYGKQNEMGLYNICGNVREMVLSQPSWNSREDRNSLGGSWFDPPSKLNVFENNFEDPQNCFTGFRILIDLRYVDDKDPSDL